MGWPLRAVLVLSFVFAPASGLANGYGNAKELIIEAERHFTAGRDDEALAALAKALRAQSTADRWRKPYGYARYIHFRLAKHHHAKSDSKRAKQELQIALKINDAQAYVDEGYQVLPRDPFIVKNYPELARLKTTRHPAHAIAPRTVYVHGAGGYVFTVGFTALGRLDPKTSTLETLFDQPNDQLYRFDASADGKRVILAYERDPHLYVIDLDPYDLRRVRRIGGVDRLHLSRSGKHAFVCSRSRYGLTVRRTPLDGSGSATEVLRVNAHVLEAERDHVVYSTYSAAQGRFHPAYSPLYEHVISASFAAAGSKPTTLYTFSPVTFGNYAAATSSRTGALTALYVHDVGRRKHELLLHDWATGKTHRWPAPAVLAQPRRRLMVEFSFKEDYVVVVDEDAGRLRLQRVDLKSGAPTVIGVVDPAIGRRGATGDAPAVHAFGVLRDNRTVWIHRGDALVLVDDAGKVARANLVPLSRRPRPEWAGATFYFPDPEQLYLGIEHKASRDFMKVDLAQIRRLAR
jgi:hypothetical protein